MKNQLTSSYIPICSLLLYFFFSFFISTSSIGQEKERILADSIRLPAESLKEFKTDALTFSFFDFFWGVMMKKKLIGRLCVAILLMVPAIGYSQDPNQPDAEGTVTAATPHNEVFDTNDDITLHGSGTIKNNEPILWIKGKITLELQERVQTDPDTFQYFTIPFPQQPNPPAGCTFVLKS